MQMAAGIFPLLCVWVHVHVQTDDNFFLIQPCSSINRVYGEGRKIHSVPERAMHYAFCTVSTMHCIACYRYRNIAGSKWRKPHTQLVLDVMTSHSSLHNQLNLYKWESPDPVYIQQLAPQRTTLLLTL